MSGSVDKPDKLVIVVHGVGDPQPGQTISLFARSLATEHQPLTEHQSVIWLNEKSNDDYVKTFPAHQRQLESEEQTLELCETFWGDLSRVRSGWLGVILGMFQIIFGLRYVAYIAADQPGLAARWLKRLGLISSKMLHGPVLAVTFYLAILMAAACGTQILWAESYKTKVWQQVVLLGCSGLALVAAAIGARLTGSRVIERFWFWVKVTTMFVTGLMFLKLFWLDALFPELAHDCPLHPGLLWYCRILLNLLGFLWFAEIQVLFAMAACWFFAMAHPRTYRPGLHVAFLVPALAVGIWGQAIPMIWVSARQGLSLIDRLPKFAAIFDDALPFLGVQLMMLAIIAIAGSIVILRYAIWRKSATIEKFNLGSRPPRLIINRSLQIVIAVCSAVGVLLVSSLCIIQMTNDSYTAYRIGRLMVEVNKYALSILVPMGGLTLIMIPKLRPAFDMLLDVINHFYFRHTDMDDALQDDDEFDIAETTFENGTLFFARRDALHQRLKRILTHYREKYDHHPELVIVSHSQGTMVAIEVLNDDELHWINNSFRTVSLVTMGSPISNLYQLYFGHFYPHLDQPFWSSLKLRLDNWTNYCRIDDFVGTVVEFPRTQVSPNSIGKIRATQYINQPVGPRGHTNYWSDQEVLKHLRAKLLEPSTENPSQRRVA